MDFITGLGIVADNFNRNQSYRDLGKIREETRKSNELAEEKNALLKEQNALLKAMALEKGVDIRTEKEKRAEALKKEKEEKAKELGISVEEYEHREFTKALEERRKKKAEELGVSVEEYEAQKAIERTETGSGCTTIILIILGVFGLIGFFAM